MHPLEFAAEAHLRFVSIHPFRDGNGRTGRLLINFLLLRAGYPIVIISNPVRAAYIDAIAQAQQGDSGIHPLQKPGFCDNASLQPEKPPKTRFLWF